MVLISSLTIAKDNVALPSGTSSTETSPTVSSPKQFDCIVKVEARDDSNIIYITIEISQIETKVTKILSRKNINILQAGVSDTMEALDRITPDIIEYLFKRTQGVIAQFDVSIHTRGIMLPIKLPRILAIEMINYFNKLNDDNSLIVPNFRSWIHYPDKGKPIVSPLEKMYKNKS